MKVYKTLKIALTPVIGVNKQRCFSSKKIFVCKKGPASAQKLGLICVTDSSTKSLSIKKLFHNFFLMVGIHENVLDTQLI
jgi:hypothetical protein